MMEIIQVTANVCAVNILAEALERTCQESP